ncbi:MAG: hypothetical protein ACOCX1_04575, partial [Fimbriimonadaceae bacterium]
ELDANQAFQWLGTGGFVNDDYRVARVATFSVGAAKQLTQYLGEGAADWEIGKYNRFKLDLSGAQRVTVPIFHAGRIETREVYERQSKQLPLVGAYKKLIALLMPGPKASELMRQMNIAFPTPEHYTNALECLEAMLVDGWVKGKKISDKPTMEQLTPEESNLLHKNRDDLYSKVKEPANT